MSSLVQANASLVKAMAALKTAMLDGGFAGLYQNDITPTVNTLLADLTEADFTGYARVTLAAWLVPYLSAERKGASISPIAIFRQVAPFTVGNQIYGWFVLDKDGVLMLSGRFDNPISMVDINGIIELIVTYFFGN